MNKEVGFVTMGAEKGEVGEIPELGIGMLGYAFMGKAHSNAYRKIPYIYWPPAALPKLVTICGRSAAAVAEAAQKFGYEKSCLDWHEMVDDPAIHVLDNGGPNNIHAEPCIAAARVGKHVICEKPLARTAAEAKEMLDAAEAAGVKHMCGFNYRFVPAVRLMRQLIEGGKIGRIFHFRAQYLQEWIVDPDFPLVWRMDKEVGGSGAMGDFSHIVDLGRFLCGEPRAVSAITQTFVKERPLPDHPDRKGKVEVDDAFAAIVEYENGAIGTLEGSRFCPGRKNYETVEVNGSEGSLFWNLENMNVLRVYYRNEPGEETRGFHEVSVTEAYHPFYDVWWPHGHIIGWEHTFVHQIHHFLDAVVHDKEVGPYAATFEDGYRAAVICDAMLKSAETGKRVEICT